jgi:non-canonical poly(A) RNA polymerase PAPD5/7
MASEREFLKTNRAKTPELMPGMDIDQGTVTYKPMDDMSDSDEAEMDFSNSDEEEDSEQPRKRQKAADGDSVPRWSNPDPYTALPPPDADRKKRDVVKLIRKARVTSALENATKTEAAADDFISFDFDEEEDDKPQNIGGGVAGAPTGPRSSLLQNISSSPDARSRLTVDRSGYETQLPPVPPIIANGSKGTTLNKISGSVVDLTSDPNLGIRKRTRGDVLKPPPQIHAPGPTPGKQSKPDGNVVKAWLPTKLATPTPWMSLDHSASANLGVW